MIALEKNARIVLATCLLGAVMLPVSATAKEPGNEMIMKEINAALALCERSGDGKYDREKCVAAVTSTVR